MKKGEKSFGFFCHLLDSYHFVLVYVCIDFIEEGRYVIKQQMMNSLNGYPMTNILEQLKINIGTAMKRCHTDAAKKYIALAAYVRCRRRGFAETAVVSNRAHTCISLNNNATPSAYRKHETRLVRK